MPDKFCKILIDNLPQLDNFLTFIQGGWVHSVAFSPSGNKIAWVGHDSSISVQSGGAKDVATLKGEFLPFLSCIWVTENTLVAAGNSSSMYFGLFDSLY